MTVSIDCACGQRTRAPEEYRGRKVRCGGCGGLIVVPDPPRGSVAPGAKPDPQEVAREADARWARTWYWEGVAWMFAVAAVGVLSFGIGLIFVVPHVIAWAQEPTARRLNRG